MSRGAPTRRDGDELRPSFVLGARKLVAEASDVRVTLQSPAPNARSHYSALKSFKSRNGRANHEKDAQQGKWTKRTNGLRFVLARSKSKAGRNGLPANKAIVTGVPVWVQEHLEVNRKVTSSMLDSLYVESSHHLTPADRIKAAEEAMWSRAAAEESQEASEKSSRRVLGVFDSIARPKTIREEKDPFLREQRAAKIIQRTWRSFKRREVEEQQHVDALVSRDIQSVLGQTVLAGIRQARRRGFNPLTAKSFGNKGSGSHHGGSPGSPDMNTGYHGRELSSVPPNKRIPRVRAGFGSSAPVAAHLKLKKQGPPILDVESPHSRTPSKASASHMAPGRSPVHPPKGSGTGTPKMTTGLSSQITIGEDGQLMHQELADEMQLHGRQANQLESLGPISRSNSGRSGYQPIGENGPVMFKKSSLRDVSTGHVTPHPEDPSSSPKERPVVNHIALLPVPNPKIHKQVVEFTGAIANDAWTQMQQSYERSSHASPRKAVHPVGKAVHVLTSPHEVSSHLLAEGDSCDMAPTISGEDQGKDGSTGDSRNGICNHASSQEQQHQEQQPQEQQTQEHVSESAVQDGPEQEEQHLHQVQPDRADESNVTDPPFQLNLSESTSDPSQSNEPPSGTPATDLIREPASREETASKESCSAEQEDQMLFIKPSSQDSSTPTATEPSQGRSPSPSTSSPIPLAAESSQQHLHSPQAASPLPPTSEPSQEHIHSPRTLSPRPPAQESSQQQSPSSPSVSPRPPAAEPSEERNPSPHTFSPRSAASEPHHEHSISSQSQSVSPRPPATEESCEHAASYHNTLSSPPPPLGVSIKSSASSDSYTQLDVSQLTLDSDSTPGSPIRHDLDATSGQPYGFFSDSDAVAQLSQQPGASCEDIGLTQEVYADAQDDGMLQWATSPKGGAEEDAPSDGARIDRSSVPQPASTILVASLSHDAADASPPDLPHPIFFSDPDSNLIRVMRLAHEEVHRPELSPDETESAASHHAGLVYLDEDPVPLQGGISNSGPASSIKIAEVPIPIRSETHTVFLSHRPARSPSPGKQVVSVVGITGRASPASPFMSLAPAAPSPDSRLLLGTVVRPPGRPKPGSRPGTSGGLAGRRSTGMIPSPTMTSESSSSHLFAAGLHSQDSMAMKERASTGSPTLANKLRVPSPTRFTLVRTTQGPPPVQSEATSALASAVNDHINRYQKAGSAFHFVRGRKASGLPSAQNVADPGESSTQRLEECARTRTAMADCLRVWTPPAPAVNLSAVTLPSQGAVNGPRPPLNGTARTAKAPKKSSSSSSKLGNGSKSGKHPTTANGNSPYMQIVSPRSPRAAAAHVNTPPLHHSQSARCSMPASSGVPHGSTNNPDLQEALSPLTHSTSAGGVPKEGSFPDFPNLIPTICIPLEGAKEVSERIAYHTWVTSPTPWVVEESSKYAMKPETLHKICADSAQAMRKVVKKKQNPSYGSKEKAKSQQWEQTGLGIPSETSDNVGHAPTGDGCIEQEWVDVYAPQSPAPLMTSPYHRVSCPGRPEAASQDVGTFPNVGECLGGAVGSAVAGSGAERGCDTAVHTDVGAATPGRVHLKTSPISSAALIPTNLGTHSRRTTSSSGAPAMSAQTDGRRRSSGPDYDVPAKPLRTVDQLSKSMQFTKAVQDPASDSSLLSKSMASAEQIQRALAEGEWSVQSRSSTSYFAPSTVKRPQTTGLGQRSRIGDGINRVPPSPPPPPPSAASAGPAFRPGTSKQERRGAGWVTAAIPMPFASGHGPSLSVGNKP